MGEYITITSSSGLISFGNTGARLSDPRATYATMLNALKEFRRKNKKWASKDQDDFAKLLTQKEIFDIRENTIVGSAKDVRVKTGFITQMGFTTSERTITPVGNKLMKFSNNFSKNEFQISKESFIYLKQFLKYQQDDFQVLPLFSLIYAILDFENELPIDFLTYIWSGSKTEKQLKQNIKIYKENNDYKATVYKQVLSTDNIEKVKKNIKAFFEKYDFSDKERLKNLLYAILPHGRSSGFKDKAISLFYDIYKYWLHKETWSTAEKKDFIQQKIKSRYKDISSKKSSYYLEVLFGTTSIKKTSDWEEIIAFFESSFLILSQDESSFILNFHILYVFIKRLSVCEEYRDLNIRHLKLLDIFVFENTTIKLDIVFLYLFKDVKDRLIKVKPLSKKEYRAKLEISQDNLGEVCDFFKIDISFLLEQITADFPEVKNQSLKNFALNKKEERLLNLVHRVFNKENIITLFENIYPRNDAEVRKLIKKWYQEYDASIPALFEYLLGISFYFLCEKKVKISDILNFSLDANLLPKTHIAGGRADIIVPLKHRHYIIEATLSENDGQRKMEAEPVPRHLAKYILKKNPNTFAFFVAGKLDPNNLVVLRNYKFSPWYDKNEFIKQMNILPLSIKNMIYILKKETNFKRFETKIEKLLNSKNKDGFQWYEDEVNPIFLYETK